MASIQTLSDSDRRTIAHMGAYALGAVTFAAKAVSLAEPARPEIGVEAGRR